MAVDRCPECHWFKPVQMPQCKVCDARGEHGNKPKGVSYSVFEIDEMSGRIVPGLGPHDKTGPRD